MSEFSTCPLLLLMVPPQHEIDPEALRDLRRAVSDAYGAELWVRPFDVPTTDIRLHLIGDWARRTEREVWDSLQHSIEAGFDTLDGLGEAG